METPNTPAGHRTEIMMAAIKRELPSMGVSEYNRVYSAIFSALERTTSAHDKRSDGERSDKERLDWYEKQCHLGIAPDWDDGGFFFTRVNGYYTTANTLRQCIDAALAAQTEGKK